MNVRQVTTEEDALDILISVNRGCEHWLANALRYNSSYHLEMLGYYVAMREKSVREYSRQFNVNFHTLLNEVGE